MVSLVTPLHWIYDQGKVAGLVAEGVAEFSQESHCPYYTVPAGEVSISLPACHPPSLLTIRT